MEGVTNPKKAVAFHPQKYLSVTVTDHMRGESFQYLLHATKLWTCQFKFTYKWNFLPMIDMSKWIDN